jgi:hypothetical protein
MFLKPGMEIKLNLHRLAERVTPEIHLLLTDGHGGCPSFWAAIGRIV